MAKKKAQLIAPNILDIVPLQREFHVANDEILGLPFEKLDELHGDTDAVFVLLPVSYDSGDAVGYTKELIEEGRTIFPHVVAKHIQHQFFGSYIRGASLLIVMSKKPVKFDTSNLPMTTFKDFLPTALRHAPKNVGLNALTWAQGVRYGFEYSHLNALPELSTWGNKRLVIEELVDGVLTPRRITKEEISEMMGVSSITEVNDILGLIPARVIDRLREYITQQTEP